MLKEMTQISAAEEVEKKKGSRESFMTSTKLAKKRKQESREQRNDENPSPFLGCYRNFCELDLIEFQRIQNLIKSRRTIKKIDSNSIYCVLNGQSIFSLFDGKL